MLLIKPYKFHASSVLNPPKLQKPKQTFHQDFCAGKKIISRKDGGRGLVIRACQGEEKKSERRSFLSLEEAGLVEISGLSTHERFLCRLTISSLNLLRVISEQEGFPIEELNAGRICDWFVKDKLKREQNLESAVLRWDDSDFQL
ncbi:hypothetical protein CKAN_01707200 [Cinnamomum micranthum f. kanehirae]|uniref:Receptor-interacting protein n=1 Tax=Cinnamomum micranthum f. kanehirae TaxID=337451 RepID=A0A3S3NI63_9MAGN|nr:hypothetical protein CKAN_01707200 [Cinnamomum micranthum f. kanehirae]